VRQLTGTVNGVWETSNTVPVRRQVAGIAAGVGGDVYVAEVVLHVEGGSEEWLVDQFNAEGRFVGRLSGAPTGPFKPINELEGSVAVDPASGDVFVGTSESA